MKPEKKKHIEPKKRSLESGQLKKARGGVSLNIADCSCGDDGGKCGDKQ